MMCLDQNKQTIYYALLQGTVETTDASGNYTGEYTPSYSDPLALRVNVSAARGTAETEQFGINERYTKTLVTDDMACPIAEDSVLWIGIPAQETVYTLVQNALYFETAFPGPPIYGPTTEAQIVTNVTSETGPIGDDWYSFVLDGNTYHTEAQYITQSTTVLPYNYTITRVARSLNSITYAVREVKVSE